jgi:hypothetical protein
MAEQVQKDILVKASFDDNGALKNIADMRKEVDDLRKAQKELDTTTEEGRIEYERLGLQIKAISKDIQSETKVVLDAQKVKEMQEGSLKAMRLELNNAKNAYAELSKTEREGAKGQEMLKYTAALNAELKELESSYGDNQRKVGEYENAGKALIATNGKLGATFNIIKGGSAGITQMFKGATTALGGLIKQSIAFIATPLGAILAVIALAVGVIIGVFNKMMDVIKGNEEQYAKLQQIMAPFRVLVDALTRVFEGLADVFLNIASAITPLITMFTDWVGITKDATAETERYIQMERDRVAVAKATREVNEKIANDEIKISDLRAKVVQKEKYTTADRLKMIDQISKMEKGSAAEKKRIAEENLRILEEEAKATKNAAEFEDKLSQARQEVSKATVDLNNKERELNGQRTTILQEQATKEKEATDKAKAAAKAASDARKAALDKELALTRAAHDAELNSLQDGFNKQSTIIRNNYSKQIDDLNKRLKEEKDLTEKGRTAINTQIVELEKQQQRELSKLFTDFQESLLGNLDKTVDEQVAAVTKKYDKLRAELATIGKPIQLAGQSDEDYKKELDEYHTFLFERATLEYRIEKQKEKEIQDLRDSGIAKQMQDIETKIRKEYAGDLAKYATNERAKLDVLEASLTEQKKRKEAATLATYDEDARLQQVAAKRNQLDLNVALIRADQNAKQIYDAKKAYLEQEQKIYKDNADAQLEIAKELRDAEADLLNDRIAKFQEWAGQTATLLTSMNELFATQGDAELKRYEGEIDAKKKKLDAQLDSGYLSQKQYNKRVEKLDAELAEKQAQIDRENALRERRMKVFSIITDTAAGVAKAVAASPLTFGLPWSAFMLATGGVQLATVLSEPLPKAARGRLIHGRSHTSGGELIEAENGEAIINKRSTSMFAPLLSAINAAGGGVPFTAPMSDGGYTARYVESQGAMSTKGLVRAMKEAVKDIKIYTTVEDYRRADRQYTDIEQSGTF